MKRFLAAATVALFLTPVTAMAISLSEIKDNPSQYKQISSRQNSEMYLDTSSITSLRYDPPYYSMNAKAYIVSYGTNSIDESTYIFNYDYNRSTISLMKNALKTYPSVTSDDLVKICMNEKGANSGVTFSKTDGKWWKLDGTFIENADSKYNEKVVFKSGIYMLAYSIFEHYYNESF